MEWFNTLFDADVTVVDWAVYFAALLVALLIIFWLFRKVFGASSSRLSKARQPRLSVTDAAVVDDKRRLVLVRRDNVEHLVMIGGPSDIVVEQNIVRASPVEAPAARPAPVASAPSAPAPSPAPAPVPEAKPAPSAEIKAERDENALFASKAETAGAAALATGAGIVAASKSAGSSLTGVTRDATATAGEAVSGAVEKTGETIASVSGELKENVTTAIEATSNAASGLGSSLDGDFENTPVGNANLDEVGSVADPAPQIGSAHGSSASVSSEVSEATPQTGTEDEMQRLLDELSATKN